MHASKCAVLAFLSILSLNAYGAWVAPFISEIHYDNVGSDLDEMVGITVPGGAALEDWSLVLYNGSNGKPYATEAVSAQAPDAGSWWELVVPLSGVQNGPDAVALLDEMQQVIDFIAYEGVFDISQGPAAGMEARLLPVAESSATPPGFSLQRTGESVEWSWISAPATPGDLNSGLFGLNVGGKVPLPGVHYLLVAAILGWGVAVRRSGTLRRRNLRTSFAV